MGGSLELSLSLLWGLSGWYLPKYLLHLVKESILNADEHELIQVVANTVVVDFTHNKPLVDPPTVPSHVLIATCVWLPIVVALAVASRTRETLRTTVCAWATSIGTSEGLTQIFKIYVRRRRPNFMDLCGYETGQCTNSDDHIIEANLSFPSGHSSLSACGMTFLTLAVLSQLLFMQHQRVSKQSSSLQLRWYAPLVTLAAFTYTLFVGTSRIVDYWHFPSDVLAGWCLGGLTSAACFHIWFPPLWHERVGMPWSSLLSPSRRMIPDVSPPSGSLMIPLGSFVKEESLQE